MNKPLLSVWTWMTATSGTRAGARIFAALALLASAPFGAYAAESGHLGAAPLSAQQAKQPVSGTVTDESGEPLVGVTVMVKNTTTGTTTDAQGHFQLSVEPGATLVFSYLGYNTQEIAVGILESSSSGQLAEHRRSRRRSLRNPEKSFGNRLGFVGSDQGAQAKFVGEPLHGLGRTPVWSDLPPAGRRPAG